MNEDPNDQRPRMTSSLGQVSFEQPEQRQSIVVEDPTEEPVSPQGQSVQGPSRQKVEEAHRSRVEESVSVMETGARRRTEILTSLGRASTDVEFEKITFSIRTLKNREWREAITAVATFDLAHEQGYEMRGQSLARALYAIDGPPVEIVMGTNDLQQRIDFINDMDESFVSHLYDEYNKLVADIKSRYNIGTEEGMQEAVEDIKK